MPFLPMHLRLDAISEAVALCGWDIPEHWPVVTTAEDFVAVPEEERCRECARRLARELRGPVVYVVPEENRETITKKLEQLNRRAAKLGVTPITVSWAHDHTQTWIVEKVPGEPEYGTVEYARQWFAMTLEGAAARVPGWTFLATLHHTTEGNIIAAVPGCSVPRAYRNAESRCDHCQTIRRRVATYLVEETATGRVVQVGANCLADFLGNDPHTIATWAELLGAFDAWMTPMTDEDGNVLRRPEIAFSLAAFLDAAARVIRVDGWVSKKRANETGTISTASEAWGLLTMRSGTREAREKETRYARRPEDGELATGAITWAETTFGEGGREDLNDYEHNLSVVVRSGAVNLRVSGLAASLIQAYRRATQVAEERKAAADAPPSAHVGTVGERLRSVPVVVKAVIPMPPTEFGPRELIKFADDAGNLFAWFTGALGTWMFPVTPGLDGADAEVERSARSPLPGDRMWLTGTVKKHSSFQGTKQTEVSRCALASYAPEPVKAKRTRKGAAA